MANTQLDCGCDSYGGDAPADVCEKHRVLQNSKCGNCGHRAIEHYNTCKRENCKCEKFVIY